MNYPETIDVIAASIKRLESVPVQIYDALLRAGWRRPLPYPPDEYAEVQVEISIDEHGSWSADGIGGPGMDKDGYLVKFDGNVVQHTVAARVPAAPKAETLRGEVDE